MNEIKLSLTIDETNIILEALGNLPFVKVYGLVSKIQEQAGQQLGENELPDEAADDNSAPVTQGE